MSNQTNGTRREPIDMSELEPVRIIRISDEVADKLRSFIIDNNLAAGTRLPSERAMAELFGASRPTVSQALRTLSLAGLVETRRGSGAYVLRQPSRPLASMNLALDMEHEDLTHLVDLLLWLETVGATHAVENHRDEDRLEARRLLENLRQSIGETSRWIAADTIFHSAIVGMSGNPLLASIFEGVHTTLISYEYEPWVQNDAVPSWLYENEADHELAVHEPMVEALESGDRDAMVAAVKLHNDAVRLHLSLRRAPQG